MLKISVVTPLLNIIRFCAFASVIGLTTLLGACQSTEDGAAKGTEQEMYERAKNQLDGNNWAFAIATLEQMEEFFPFGTYAEHAQLELIYAYFKTDEYESALAAADRFIRPCAL